MISRLITVTIIGIYVGACERTPISKGELLKPIVEILGITDRMSYEDVKRDQRFLCETEKNARSYCRLKVSPISISIPSFSSEPIAVKSINVTFSGSQLLTVDISFSPEEVKQRIELPKYFLNQFNQAWGPPSDYSHKDTKKYYSWLSSDVSESVTFYYTDDGSNIFIGWGTLVREHWLPKNP